MDTTDVPPFGVLLRRCRLAAGLSQETLAERAHMSVRGISDLERGVRRAPHRETLRQIMDALTLPPDDRAALEAAAEQFRPNRALKHRAPVAQPTGMPLLETKIGLPAPTSRLVPRARLIERLRTGLRGTLTLLSAPPGSGKTTLVQAWHVSRDGLGESLAWVSLDSADNDPVVFWTYVCTALERAVPGAGKPALAMLRSPQPPGGMEVVAHLLNAFSAYDGQVVLALDDYHVITSEEIHQSIVFLLERIPRSLHVLIASRSDPPLRLSGMRARGQVVEILAEHLRFTADETTSYLGDIMGLGLSSSDLGHLHGRTEGWVAGLQLAALSLQGRSQEEASSFIRAFAGSHRHVVDYLSDEVLERQPEPVRVFLLRTSILDRLTAPLCAAVMGGVGSSQAIAAARRTLEDLERRHVFVVPLDDERRWYRYHQLFRDALRNHIQQTDPDIIPTLHRRASAWYAEHGMLDEAISHALLAGMPDQAGQLMQQVVWERFAQGKNRTLRTWMDALPDSVVRSSARLCAVRTFLSLDTGTDRGVDSYLEDAEAALEATASGAEADLLRGEIGAIRAVVAAARGDSAQTILQSQDALSRLGSQNRPLGEIVALLQSGAHLAQGDLLPAMRSFEGAAVRARADMSVRTALVAEVSVSYIQRARGELSAAAETCRRALEWGDQHGSEFPMTGGLHLNLADIARERNELEEARARATAAHAILHGTGRFDLQILGSLGLARIAQAESEFEAAAVSLENARHIATTNGAAWALGLVGACRAQVALAAGDLDDATRWLDESLRYSAQPALVPAFFVYIQEHTLVAPHQVRFAHARTTSNEAELHECIVQLQQLRERAERMGVLWLRIKSLVLEAIAHRALSLEAESYTVLREAFALAEREGYSRVFLDEGEPITQLIGDMAASPDASGQGTQILRLLTR